MTIAIGVLCSNGVVVAADTEVVQGDIKGTMAKALAAECTETGSLGFAGAGHIGNIESIKLDLSIAVLKALGPEAQNDSKVKQAIIDVVVPFHAKHVPFYGRQESSRDFDTLIATWSKGQGRIWCTDGTAPRQSFEFDAIGCGATYALEYLTGLYQRGPVDSSVLLASYVMMRVKSVIRDCGKETQIIVSGEGVSTILSHELTREMDYLWEHNAGLQKQVFLFASGFESNYREVSKTIRFVRSEFDHLRQSIRESISSIDHI